MPVGLVLIHGRDHGARIARSRLRPPVPDARRRARSLAWRLRMPRRWHDECPGRQWALDGEPPAARPAGAGAARCHRAEPAGLPRQQGQDSRITRGVSRATIHR